MASYSRIKTWNPGETLKPEDVSSEFDNLLTSINAVADDVSSVGTYAVPVGAITMFGSATAPDGWLQCDGTAISRTTYSSLFTIVSTTFGAGNGSSTFNLPDFRGVFPKGAGTTNRTAGKDANGNYYTGTLGTYLQDKIQGHKHSMAGNTGGTAQYVEPNGAFTATGAGTALQYFTLAVSFPTTDGTNGTPRTGGTTEPQSLGVHFIIKY